jgi:hypothetical protein
MIEKIIWQPVGLYQPGHSFQANLDREFAVDMANTTISKNTQNAMNKMGSECYKGYGFSTYKPYLFHENTGFVRQINLKAGDGVCLAVSDLYGKAPDMSSDRPLVYDTHNVSNLDDKIALLSLFDNWISYCDILKNER